MKRSSPALLLWCALMHGALSASAAASGTASVLVPDFGLNDDTLLPRVPAELARTAAVAPRVRATLASLGHRVVTPPASATLDAHATQGYRYLLAHPASAAALGRSAGTAWVAVGRVDKPSFLFAYFVIDLVETATGRVVAHLETSPRGGMANGRVQARAAEDLAREVHAALAAIAARRAGLHALTAAR